MKILIYFKKLKMIKNQKKKKIYFNFRNMTKNLLRI